MIMHFKNSNKTNKTRSIERTTWSSRSWFNSDWMLLFVNQRHARILLLVFASRNAQVDDYHKRCNVIRFYSRSGSFETNPCSENQTKYHHFLQSSVTEVANQLMTRRGFHSRPPNKLCVTSTRWSVVYFIGVADWLAVEPCVKGLPWQT